MKNSEIIQFIDRFCAYDEELDVVNNADLAYAILAHGYLYIRPGKPTQKFALKVVEALKVGARVGFDNYLKDGCRSWPLDEWVRISMAESALKIARKMFEKKHFERLCALLDPDEECDKSLLDKYLNLMNNEQLCAFMSEVSFCRANYLAFSTFETEVEIRDGLHERCREINPMLPETTSGYKYVSFVSNNPQYLFDYLSKEEIVSAIKSEIVCNKTLAGHMARMLYNTNDACFMEPYIELISTYERIFGGDIYKPDIFYEPLYLN